MESQGVLCVPIWHDCPNYLDVTLVKFGSLIQRADHLLAQEAPSHEELVQLEDDALLLQQDFVGGGQSNAIHGSQVWLVKCTKHLP